MEARGQLVGVGFLSLPPGSWELNSGHQALPVEPPYWPSFPFLFMTQQFKRPENQAGTSVGGVKMAGECARQCLLLDRRPQTAEGNCTGCGKDPVFRLLPAASSWPPGAMKTAQHTEDGEGSWGLLSLAEAALLGPQCSHF